MQAGRYQRNRTPNISTQTVKIWGTLWDTSSAGLQPPLRLVTILLFSIRTHSCRCRHPSKRQKHHHHVVRYIEPPGYWERLSKVWLTRRALRELNRRNRNRNTPQPSSPQSQAHRPITRAFEAERKKPAEFLRHCPPKRLKDIKRFARRGGPDLSHLIGACSCATPQIFGA
jgi:hypothetical protein